MMSIFQTAMMTLKQSDGTVVQTNLPVQMDVANLPWNVEVQGAVAVDIYDVVTQGWTTPVPERSDYLVDQATGIRYSMFSTVFTALTCLQFQVSKYSGVTP
jgi:hypothetical protein